MASDRLKRQIDRLLGEAEEAVTQLNWTVVRSRAQAFLSATERALGAASPPAVTQTPAAASSPSHTSTPSPAQPTSFAGGRYQVNRLLGEGSKKKVYLAHDQVVDREVALAVIKTEGLDEVSRARITREARAMGRLGDHPNILPIYDLGEDQGQPYLVLPFMQGGDLERLIYAAADHRLSLDLSIAIGKEICRGLQFAHSKGVIHRDLKPGNVWLTAEGTAKIGDFGLAVVLDFPRLTQERMMVGTVSYVAPEQALGSEVTLRSDLYSLGCMLYEMVTGRLPFLGDDSVAIIGQHINTQPVAPTWHNAECPRPLEALILRLLAKDPRGRPESAADVLAALEAIDLGAGVETGPPSTEARVLDSLAGGVFVGRQQEMGELKAALEDALSGRGRLVTLVGEPGIGKTRTAQELATYAGLRHSQVLWGRCYEGEGAPPYWPWIQAIRSYVRERDASALRSEMGAGAADIAEVVSDVRERLPDLKPPPQLEPEQARFRLFDSICGFLKGAGRQQPLVLILEDLHWADRPSLLLLEFLAKELANARMLLIGTYRDMEVSRGHPLSNTLGALNRERLFQRILLRGLSEEDVGRFIRLVSGITPLQGLVEAVYRQTEGSPLFVTEVVRLLVQEGHLTPEGRGGFETHPETPTTWNVRIPEGVREVIGRRLDRLSERCNETLTIASVIGREFTLEQLKPLIADMTEDRLLEVLEEALSARVIEELPRTVGRYQFTHALIQETLAEELSTTRRVRLHARIAAALEELYGSQAEAHAAELAHHFGEAQTVLGTGKLVSYSLLAGERALSAYAWEEALAHFQQGLAARGIPLTNGVPAPDGEAARLLFGLGRAQAATFETHEMGGAMASLGRAFDFYAETGDVDRAVAVAEYPLFAPSFRLPGAVQLVARALGMVPPESLAAGRLQSRYGWFLGMEQSDYQGAHDVFARALTIAQQESDPGLAMRTLANAAEVEAYYNHSEESMRNGLRAVALASRVDDPNAELLARYWTSFRQIIIGESTAASQHAAAMLGLAERMRHHFYMARTLFVNEALSRLKGEWQAARGFSDRGLTLSPREPRLLAARLVLEFEVGNIGEGEAHLERLLEAAQLTPPGPSNSYAIAAMIIPTVSRISGVANRLDKAERFTEAVLSSPSATPLIGMIARIGAALTAVMTANITAAGAQYPTLKSQQGTAMVFLIAADRLLGLLANTMGQFDLASGHFEDALTFCRKAGYRPELAWTCCDYADCLLQRSEAGDRQKAVSLLTESLAISQELGMGPLTERVLSRRESLAA